MINLNFLKPVEFMSMVNDYHKPVVVVVDSTVIRSIECMIVTPGRAAEMLSRKAGRFYLRSFDMGAYVLVALTVTPSKGKEYVIYFTDSGIAYCNALRTSCSTDPDDKYLLGPDGIERQSA